MYIHKECKTPDFEQEYIWKLASRKSWNFDNSAVAKNTHW